MNAIKTLLRRPFLAHVMAAMERYNTRLGPQFAAAVTYFSVLSLVPMIMFAFSMLGMTLTVLRPEWLAAVNDLIDQQLDSSDTAQSVKQVIENALLNWRSTGLVALVTAAYSGAGWVGNLKRAIRVMWRDHISEATSKRNIVLETLTNLLIFLGILVCVFAAMGVTILGGTFSETLIGWLNLQEVAGISLIMRLLSILLSFLASWILLAFLFFALPGERTTARTFLLGTAGGAVAITILQQLAGVLVGIFSGNKGTAIFGPAIVLILVLNILAQLILIATAWIGTADTWQSDQLKKDVEEALGDAKPKDEDDAEGPRVPDPKPITAAEQLRRDRFAARRSIGELRAESFDPETAQVPRAVPVSPEVAQRGMRTSYRLGAAAGVGLGAALTWLMGKIFRR